MQSSRPEIALGLNNEAEPVVLVGDQAASTVVDLLRLAPDITEDANAAMLAQALNHLASGDEFAVITDPAAYVTAYRAKLATEDPTQPAQPGVIRLCDFGTPNFAAITPPRMDRGTLIFFAVRTYWGLPYRASVVDLTDPPVYQPVPLGQAAPS